VSGLAALVPVWLDAGVSSVDRARHALRLGIAHVIVGLETLCSWEALREICVSIGGDRVAFSLDLRDGALTVRDGGAGAEPAHVVAAHAVEAGVDSIIVIDVKKVGTGAGLDLELIRSVRQAAPGVALLAGGGVRGIEDLQRLADVGCDGALVATALQRGTLGVPEIRAMQRSCRVGS
jgi:phosphoribosylformimino-5-aminoimidazole carboxamide ribotide isomerase